MSVPCQHATPASNALKPTSPPSPSPLFPRSERSSANEERKGCAASAGRVVRTRPECGTDLSHHFARRRSLLPVYSTNLQIGILLSRPDFLLRSNEKPVSLIVHRLQTGEDNRVGRYATLAYERNRSAVSIGG